MESMRLYRIELEYKGERITYHPQVPKSLMDSEDNKTKRVCCAPTIIGCIRALELPYSINNPNDFFKVNYLEQEIEIHLYSSEVHISDIVQPTSFDVPDQFVTGELWVTGVYDWDFVTKLYMKEISQIEGAPYSIFGVRYENRKFNYDLPIVPSCYEGSCESFTFIEKNKVYAERKYKDSLKVLRYYTDTTTYDKVLNAVHELIR